MSEVYPGLEWLSINGGLTAASQALTVEDLIHTESFSLFEAMSAVEVGNPKMDAASTPTVSVESWMERGAAPTEVSLAQQLAVMEHLVLMQVNYLCQGAPAASSIYGNLYMLQPNRIETSCPLLFAFCEGMHAVCVAARWLVVHGGVAEDEDFNLMVVGLPLESGASFCTAATPDATCHTLLAKAEHSAAAPQPDADASVLKGIASRLRMVRELQSALLDIRLKSSAGCANAVKHLAAALSALDSAHAAAPSAQELEVVVGSSEGLNRHMLGPAPPRIIKMPTQVEAYNQLRKTLQHLTVAMQVAQATSYRHVQQFTERVAGLHAGILPRSAAHYLIAGSAWAAAAAQPGSPLVGTAPSPATAPNAQPSPDAPSWVLDCPLICEALALPTSFAPGSLGADVDLFLEQAVIAVGNWAQAMLLNSCRQRRRLRRGLEDWANLYQHALNADLSADFITWAQRLGWVWTPGQAGAVDAAGMPDLQGPLATWVEYGTAGAQYLHLLLGSSLELYTPAEFTQLYWYLAHLARVRKTDLQLLHSVQAPAGGKLPLLPAKPNKGVKGVKAAVRSAPSPVTVRREAALLSDAFMAEMHGHMATGLTRMMLALQREGLVTVPQLPFNTLRERFDQRFAIFHSPSLVRPEPLNYDQFVEATNVDDVPSERLLMLAAESLSHVRHGCDAIKVSMDKKLNTPVADALSPEQQVELVALEKVAKTNTLAAVLLSKGLEPAAAGAEPSKLSLTVDYDFSTHPFFFSLKLKSSQRK